MTVDEDLAARLQRLGVDEADLEEQFIKGWGAGGQKINKTASCVFLKHLKSGVEVKCQDGRSLVDNRLQARRRLCAMLEERERKRRAEGSRKRAKERFKKRKRSARQKAKIVADKRHRGQTKQLRGRVRGDG